jgi:hypothetical protein
MALTVVQPTEQCCLIYSIQKAWFRKGFSFKHPFKSIHWSSGIPCEKYTHDFHVLRRILGSDMAQLMAHHASCIVLTKKSMEQNL